MVKKIACYSGGKDSTAMLIHILTNDLPCDEVIYVDTGDWMWHGSKNHIKQVEKKLNISITSLDISTQLEKGFQKWGFPSMLNRWCTGEKRDIMKRYIQTKYPYEEIIQYIGYTSDEKKRISKKLFSAYDVEYPLVEAEISGDDAMKMCDDYGFDFGGVYSHHSHYNCWLCPLQKKKELRCVHDEYPDLWEKLRIMQSRTDGYFSNGKTIFQWEHTFWENDCEKLKQSRLNARLTQKEEED